jgi:hypothetical protein
VNFWTYFNDRRHSRQIDCSIQRDWFIRDGVRMNVVNQQNYQRGYDKGYEDGLSQRKVDDLVLGFWFGVGTAAVIAVLVWVTILMGKI